MTKKISPDFHRQLHPFELAEQISATKSRIYCVIFELTCADEYLLAKICVDTAENEPLEVWGKLFNIIQPCTYVRVAEGRGEAVRAPVGRRSSLHRGGLAERCASPLPFSTPRTQRCWRRVLRRRQDRPCSVFSRQNGSALRCQMK